MKKVLVTGASGFIGRYTLGALIAAGYEVHAVSSRPAAWGALRVERHLANLFEKKAMETLVETIRPTHLLHLAWIATPGIFWTSPENLEWVRASLALLQAFHRVGGTRCVSAGSSAEYSPVQTLYGRSKAAMASLQEGFAQVAGFSSAWARLFYVYGPGEPPGRLIPHIIGSLREKRPALCGSGLSERDFIYVEDVADALVLLLGSSEQGVLDIGSGEGRTIASAARWLAELMGAPELLRLGAIPDRPGESPRLIANTERLKKSGFKVRVPLEEGLRRSIAWWQRA